MIQVKPSHADFARAHWRKEMIPIMIVAAAVAQAPSQASSPLQEQADAIADSPPDVRYEFIKQIYPNFPTPRAAFRHLPIDNQKSAVLRGYYVQALKRATLLYRRDPELVAILNTITDQGDLKEVALAFERKYHEKFGTWPPIVPVDVDALIGRMLDEQTVR